MTSLHKWDTNPQEAPYIWEGFGFDFKWDGTSKLSRRVRQRPQVSLSVLWNMFCNRELWCVEAKGWLLLCIGTCYR